LGKTPASRKKCSGKPLHLHEFAANTVAAYWKRCAQFASVLLPLMTFFHCLALLGALLPTVVGMSTRRQLATDGVLPAADPNDNAMASTYGFLRTASNNVGNTVEGVLGVEGSLTDMKKDLDLEFNRWSVKKQALLAEQQQMSTEAARLRETLRQQKALEQERRRTAGDLAAKQAQNKNHEATNKEKEAKRANDKKVLDEGIEALMCQTKTIQQAKQDRVDAANKKTAVLKEQNRVLQERVFQLNKDVTKLTATASSQSIQNKDASSTLLAKVEAVQKQINGLEKELLAQAQLEETVQRSRERLNVQTAETVKQRQKLVQAQDICMRNKKKMTSDIEAAKRSLTDANAQMMQCQNLDGDNQRLQAELNSCIATKRSLR